MISQKSSASRTPNVSPAATQFQRGVCRYCGCHGRECLVPEGQAGYRTCFWMDKDETVCAAASCFFKWEQEGKPQSPTISSGGLTLAVIRHIHGIRSRVASSLNVSKQSVARVVNGTGKSARISSALAVEIERINKEVLSGNGARALETRPQQQGCGANGKDSNPVPERRAVSPSSPKPRYALRFNSEINGHVYAITSGHAPVLIGRRSQEAAG
jgi:hypothetical protein